MPNPVEQSVGVTSVPGGSNVRTIEVVTLINGTPTTVEMQVLAIGDPATGRTLTIEEFLNADWQRLVVDELRAIRIGMQLLVSDDDAVDRGAREITLIEEAQSLREEEEPV